MLITLLFTYNLTLDSRINASYLFEERANIALYAFIGNRELRPHRWMKSLI